MQTTEITLPNGFRAGKDWRRTARLRAVIGADEALLRDEGAALLPVQRTTALLLRCLASLGEETPTEAAVQGLTVGDREALLWHLRRLTFGEMITCVLSCPSGTCGEKMELELAIADLLVTSDDIGEEWRERETEEETRYRFRFRFPTGADQEIAAERLAKTGSLEEAAQTVLERCLSGVWANEEPVRGIPPVVARALPALLAEGDPQAELRLNLICPVCETAFETLLDAGLYLYQELQAQGGDLYRDVHRMASAYHWSEADILALPLPRRRMYLSLIAEQRGGL